MEGTGGRSLNTSGLNEITVNARSTTAGGGTVPFHGREGRTAAQPATDNSCSTDHNDYAG